MAEGDGLRVATLVMTLIALTAAVALLCWGATSKEGHQQQKFKIELGVTYDS